MAQRLFAPGHFDEPSVAHPLSTMRSTAPPLLSHTPVQSSHQPSIDSAECPAPSTSRRITRSRTPPSSSQAALGHAHAVASTARAAVARPPAAVKKTHHHHQAAPSLEATQTLAVKPRARPPSAAPRPPVPAPTPAGLSTPQRAHLTKHNTNRNKECYNQHHVVVVHKDEPRPPSPSAKIRKRVPGGTKEGRDSRAQKRRALKQDNEDDEMEESERDRSSKTAARSKGQPPPHPLGAGDEEGGYQTPKRPASSSSRASKKRRNVQWSRMLVHHDVAEQAVYEPNMDAAAEQSILTKVSARASVLVCAREKGRSHTILPIPAFSPGPVAGFQWQCAERQAAFVASGSSTEGADFQADLLG